MTSTTDALSHLRAALDRYVIQRELGRGGMATVYLARDLKHDRLVALKVLHPELAHALGPERFLREIELAARLQHPHILPLFDSGTANGLLYYVMPYVEGESLRQRLTREQQLPLADALRIAGEVAEALGYAHQHGVVHRDIKPENILISGQQCLVADFGIARAVDAAAGEKLTETGLALGTPTYMSPEQAADSRRLDGRSDIYALGCVLYEMLAGQPPFQGPTAQSILARHAVDPVPSLRTVRSTVPAVVEAAIAKALAKVPADRFATAEQFSHVLAAGESTPQGSHPRLSSRRIVIALAAVVAVITLAVGAFLWQRPGSVEGGADPGLLAVLPFRVAGADPALGYLREGIVDLLAVKLTGEGGPRALDPRAVLSSWHRALSSPAEDLSPGAALGVAHRLGAGRLIDGSVVGTPTHLVLTASIVTVPSGATRTRASVAGAADSLPALVDRLTAQLLAGEAGRTDLATLTSLPALRAYIDGQSALRAGRFTDAFRSFNHALELDSTFALAGIGLGQARFWDGGDDSGRGFRLAWAARDRLSPRDRAIIAPWMVPAEEHFAAAERAVAAAPERSEAWYELGDDLYHGGALLGFDAPLQRAAAAFRRALELDSSYAEPRIHLFQIAAAEGDTAAVRRFGSMAMAADSTNDFAGYLRWQMAYTLRDTAALATLRAQFDRMNEQSLVTIERQSQQTGIALDDARRAVAALLKRANTKAARRGALREQYLLAMNSGRPREGLAATLESERLREGGDDFPPDRITDALYWDGDSGAAVSGVRERARSARVLAPGAEDRVVQYNDICFVQQWRLAHGELGTARAEIERLRAAVVPGLPAEDFAAVTPHASLCADLLEAWLAVVRQSNGAALVARLDSLSRQPPPESWADGWNLVVARLLEAQGNLPGALAAVRRRAYGLAPLYLSTYVREDGRLAARVGDTAGAIRSYQHYLALRSDPEPALKPETEQARAELGRLLAEPRR